MNAQGYQQYKEQSIATMTQGELLMLLLDELVKRAAQANLALESKDFSLFETSVNRCLDIVHYLDNTLDAQYPISAELHRMYDFFCYDFSRIRSGRNQKELDRIRPLLSELRESFQGASKKTSER